MDSTENVMRTLSRKKAARKAARTRAANRASWKRWIEVDRPAIARMDVLLNHILLQSGCGTIWLRWNPLADTGRRLKHRAKWGKLVKILNGGRMLRVLAEGYRRPQDWHPAYWEFVDRRWE
jgi:hypothetical protein